MGEELGRGLIGVAGADVARGCAAVWRDGFCPDSSRVGIHLLVDGQAETNVMVLGWYIRVREVNPEVAIANRVDQSSFKFPGDKLANGFMFRHRRSEMIDRSDPGFGELNDFDFHLLPCR